MSKGYDVTIFDENDLELIAIETILVNNIIYKYKRSEFSYIELSFITVLLR